MVEKSQASGRLSVPERPHDLILLQWTRSDGSTVRATPSGVETNQQETTGINQICSFSENQQSDANQTASPRFGANPKESPAFAGQAMEVTHGAKDTLAGANCPDNSKPTGLADQAEATGEIHVE